MRSRKKPTSSKFVKSLLKVLFVAAVSFLLVEIVMTVFEPQLFKGFYQYDPDLGFRVRGHVRAQDGSQTNQFGFNARDYPLEKSSNVFRILMVGDSFNWSGGRDRNYTAYLERKFEALHGTHKVEVINAGYPGTHTAEQLAMLKKFGLQYNPDLVVLGFFAGNDFFDADPNRKRIIVNDTYIDIDGRRERRLLGRPVILKSRLYLFLKQRYTVWQEQRAVRGEGGGPDSFSEDIFLSIERRRLDLFSLSATREQKYRPNIDYILQSLAEMAALLKSRNIGFVVAIYPDEFQVNELLLKTLFERYQLDSRDFDMEFAQKTLKSFLNASEIPCIDFIDRFRAVEPQRPLYIPRNTHWNNAGNELAAEILFEELKKRLDVSRALAGTDR